MFRALFNKLRHRPATPAGKNATQVVAKEGKIMLYEVLATGERLHLRDSDTSRALVATGQIKPVVKEPWKAPKTPAQFYIHEEYLTGHYVVCWDCKTCRQSGRFPGVRPDAIGVVRAWHCGHVGGEAVPEHVQSQYRTLNPAKISAPVVVAGEKRCPENETLAADLATRQAKNGMGVL